MGPAEQALAVVDQATSIVAPVVEQATRSTVEMASSKSWAALVSSLERLGSTWKFANPLPIVQPAQQQKSAKAALPDPRKFGFDVAALLKRILLAELDLEQVTPTSATFALEGDSVRVLKFEGSRALGDFFDALKLRVTATVTGKEGVDLVVSAGPDRASPLAFRLRPGEMAADLDLGAAKESVAKLLTAIEKYFGKVRLKPQSLPECAGRIRTRLISKTKSGFALATEIVEPLSIKAQLATGPLSLKIGACPLATLEADGDKGTIRCTLKVGTIECAIPLAALVEATATKSVVKLHLAGLGVDTDFSQAAQALKLKGLSLGDKTATLALDGKVFLSCDINAQSGRSLDATLNPNAKDGSVRIEVSPQLDMRVQLAFASLKNELGDLLPEAVLDETYTVGLKGPGTPVVVSFPEGPKFLGAIEVQNGTLTILCDKAKKPIVVNKGYRLRRRPKEDPRPDEEHPALALLDVARADKN